MCCLELRCLQKKRFLKKHICGNALKSLIFRKIYVTLLLVYVFVLSLDELLVEKERVRNLTAEIETTVQEIQGS